MTRTDSSAVVTLPADTDILITREFDAPRHLLYRVWTTPELIRRWWSGDRGEVNVVELDLRVGGRWRYVMTANEGFEVAFHGVFMEIVPNEQIVNTEVYEGAEGPGEAGAAVVTTTFTEADGRTTLTQLSRFPSREIRDLVLASGMEVGMQEAMNHLELVARSLH
jgi:uncharacterized protein YndB with AHSA1/START domain